MEQASIEELGKLRGRGATAEIYEWKNNQVLKLINSGFPTELIEREAKKLVCCTCLDIKFSQLEISLRSMGG